MPSARPSLLSFQHLLLLLPFGPVVASCSIVAPELVEQHQFGSLGAPIRKLAVLPFQPKPQLARSTAPSGTEAWEAAALVTRFVTEAIQKRGVAVIPQNDVQLAFEGHGKVTPRMDPVSAAQLAASEFGVTAVVLGSVDRYRENEGSAYGSFGPASAKFEITLYEAPTGRRLWTGRFDQTQPELSSNLFTSARYPNRGTRFLTVAELAQWGAGLVVAEMPLAP